MKEIFSINIICLGNWNKKIFTPAWVATNLFKLKENKIEAVFNPNELDMGFKMKDIALFPKDTSVEIKLEQINDETKILSGQLLNQLLNLLPHTPIHAIGINIRYRIKKDEELPLVKKLENIKCGLDDFNTNQIKFSKNNSEYQLNVIVDFKEFEYFVNFNFHHDLTHYADGFSFSDTIINNRIEISKNIVENE
jgi:hypothetical protein